MRYFGGAAYMDFFTGTGILSADQVDGSYTGDPSLFIADEGTAAQQGFGSAEPYLYENELTDWGKPVAYEYINDAGWENYAESIATKPENIDALSATASPSSCRSSSRPASTTSPSPLAPTRSSSPRSPRSVRTSAGPTPRVPPHSASPRCSSDGLIANGPDGIMGNFDLDRVNGLIELAVPIYEAQGASPKDGVTADDIVTNQFIDDSIGL